MPFTSLREVCCPETRCSSSDTRLFLSFSPYILCVEEVHPFAADPYLQCLVYSLHNGVSMDLVNTCRRCRSKLPVTIRFYIGRVFPEAAISQRGLLA